MILFKIIFHLYGHDIYQQIETELFSLRHKKIKN